jgi:hypothetical protein
MGKTINGFLNSLAPNSFALAFSFVAVFFLKLKLLVVLPQRGRALTKKINRRKQSKQRKQ